MHFESPKKLTAQFLQGKPPFCLSVLRNFTRLLKYSIDVRYKEYSYTKQSLRLIRKNTKVIKYIISVTLILAEKKIVTNKQNNKTSNK